MTSWTVRRARPDDAAALALIAGATLLETFHAEIPVADMLAHVSGKCSPAVFTEWVGDPGSTVFYAGADRTDAPVGYTVLTTPDFPIETGERDLELRRIYILAALHGSGLGSALMDAAIGEARDRRCRRVLLGVHPGNTRARRFYERTGFKMVGERVFPVGGSTFTDPIYALEL